jgi:hypothetical protein
LRQRLQGELEVTGLDVEAAIGLAEEEAGSSGLKGVRLEHQCDVPRRGEEAFVDFEIGVGQKDAAAGMGMVPSDGLQAGGIFGGLFQ